MVTHRPTLPFDCAEQLWFVLEMKTLPLAMLLALLMFGCWVDAKENRSLALLIPCEACGESVSKNTEKFLNCSDSAPTFVFDLEDALARIRIEQEREVATGAS